MNPENQKERVKVIETISPTVKSKKHMSKKISSNEYDLGNYLATDSPVQILEDKIMRPIIIKEKEYEAEILKVLGQLKSKNLEKSTRIIHPMTLSSPIAQNDIAKNKKFETEETQLPNVSRRIVDISKRRKGNKNKRSKSSVDFSVNLNDSWMKELQKIDKQENEIKKSLSDVNNKYRLLKNKLRGVSPCNYVSEKKQMVIDKSITEITKVIKNLTNRCKSKFDNLSHILKSPKISVFKLN